MDLPQQKPQRFYCIGAAYEAFIAKASLASSCICSMFTTGSIATETLSFALLGLEDLSLRVVRRARRQRHGAAPRRPGGCPRRDHGDWQRPSQSIQPRRRSSAGRPAKCHTPSAGSNPGIRNLRQGSRRGLPPRHLELFHRAWERCRCRGRAVQETTCRPRAARAK